MSKPNHTVVTAQIHLKLRDWAAMEDLVNAAGYTLELVEGSSRATLPPLPHPLPPLQPAAPATKKRRRKSHLSNHVQTPEEEAALIADARANPHLTDAQLAMRCNPPIGRSTCGRKLKAAWLAGKLPPRTQTRR